MSGIRQLIHSLFARIILRRSVEVVPVPVVALLEDEPSRRTLASVSSLDVYFAASCADAALLATRLNAPVILIDRDWTETEWRTAVKALASLPHRACVVLVSNVVDGYLWQDLVRRGGYDVLLKPFLADNAARVVKLALSYWRTTASKPLAQAGKG